MIEQRENILDTVTLADGRLAWPIAKARGQSETTFRQRLKKMSADEAVRRPVVARGPFGATVEQLEAFDSKCAVLRENRGRAKRSLASAKHAAIAAGLDLPQTERLARQLAFQSAQEGVACHHETAGDFAGVVVETVGERLAVKLDGSRFLFQNAPSVQGGRWRTEFAYYYLVDVVARLEGRGVWPDAASVVPSHQTACLDMLAAGELPLLFLNDSGSLRWLVRADEAGW